MPEDRCPLTTKIISKCLVSLILGLSIASCGSSSQKLSSAQASSYVVQRLGDRTSASHFRSSVRSIADLLPNVIYSREGGASYPGSAAVLVGNIVKVSKGVGFQNQVDEPGSGAQVEFDDSKVTWRTLHLTFRVERGLGLADSTIPHEVQIGLAVGSDTDFSNMSTGLKSLGRVVVFLYRSVVFAYDPSLYAIHETGTIVATIAADGRLDLPFVEKERRDMLLSSVHTLDDLDGESRMPPRVMSS